MEALADRRHGILKRSFQSVHLPSDNVRLFPSAGRLDWWNDWLLLSMYVIAIIGTGAVLIRKELELIAERASYKKDAKSWDKGWPAPWPCSALWQSG